MPGCDPSFRTPWCRGQGVRRRGQGHDTPRVPRRDPGAARGGQAGRPVAAPHARRVGRHGARARGARHGAGRGRPDPPRTVDPQLHGSRRGQHAHAPALGHRRGEGRLPPPAVRGHRHVVFRHDRARGGRAPIRPSFRPGPRRTGTSWVIIGHKWFISDACAGPSSPSWSPGPSRRATRFARRQHGVPGRSARRRLERRARGRDDARLHRPLRDPHRGSARARFADPRWAGQRPPPRPVPAGTRPPGPLYAPGSHRPRRRST